MKSVVDISINRQNGTEAVEIIRRILEKYNVLRPTIIILKILLKINQLNEASSGGMSSFLLFHLVYFYFYYKYKNIIEREESHLNGNYILCDFNLSPSKEEEEEDRNINSFKIYESNQYSNKKNMSYSTRISSVYEEYNSFSEDSDIIKNGSISNSPLRDFNLGMNKYSKNFSFENIENENSSFVEEKEINLNSINVSDFLCSFLHFFGYEFDHENYGFSCNKENIGEIFLKIDRYDMPCNYAISAESIQDKNVNVGRSCYKYENIVALFKSTYEIIKNEKKTNPISILQALSFPTIG
jgi:DNA polymerase sigma